MTGLFDRSEDLARIAGMVTQRELLEQAHQNGQFYSPGRNSISLKAIAAAFDLARKTYSTDPKLPAFQEASSNGSEPFKDMLTSCARTVLGADASDENLQFVRRVLGHMFAWRRNGRFTSDYAETVARANNYIK